MKQFLLVIILFSICNEIKYSQTATLESTLSLKDINGFKVAYQNNIPVPTFEKQKRNSINLGGVWKKKRFNADHDISLAKRDETGYLNLINESQGYYLSNFDDSAWEDKEIPSVENIINEFPTVPEYYENGVWYRYKFNVDDSLSNKFVKLMFYAVNYVADVWLNDKYLGWHEGGYTPFAFDATSTINYGFENVLAIRVDNPPWGSRKDIVPFYKSDWFNYTGIFHDIYLEFSDPISVVRADVVPQNDGSTINSKVIVYNSMLENQLITARIEVFETAINELNIHSEFAQDLISESANFTGSSEINFTLDSNSVFVWNTAISLMNPKLWSPQLPNLYVLKVTISKDGNILDEYFTQFGLRSIQTDGNKVLLNDKVVFFTGAARHEDHPIYGRSMPKDAIFEDMMIIDSSNINYLRTSHYPNNPYTYLIADRLGIAVMEEIPVWWFDNENEWLIQNNERHIHEQMFREMVFKDYNRPSILFWSTSNECKEETNRLIYNQRIAEDIRNNYFDGRLLTQSSAGDRPGSADITQQPLDLAGWTLYFGIFHGGTYYAGTLVFLTQASAAFPNKPIIDTEFGVWSSEDNSNLEKQVTVFNETFKAFQFFSPLNENGTYNSNGFLTATTWWCVFDWYSHQHPNGFQSMGLISMDRKINKPVYYALKDKYAPYYNNGGMVLTAINNEKINLQSDYKLDQNYPNPFNPTTQVKFSVPELSEVKIDLYNSIGEKIFNVLDSIKNKGKYSISINGNLLSSGVYFCKMRAKSAISSQVYESTIKIMFLK